LAKGIRKNCRGNLYIDFERLKGGHFGKIPEMLRFYNSIIFSRPPGPFRDFTPQQFIEQFKSQKILLLAYQIFG